MQRVIVIMGLAVILGCQPETSDNRLAIVDQTSATFKSDTGGTVELGEVSVTAPKGLANVDYKISIKRTAPNTTTGDATILGGSSYIIEVLGLDGAHLNPADLDKVLTFATKHKIKTDPKKIMALVIDNYSKAPELWERFYVLYKDLIVDAGLQLQDTLAPGDIVEGTFEAKITDMSLQLGEAAEPPEGYAERTAPETEGIAEVDWQTVLLSFDASTRKVTLTATAAEGFTLSQCNISLRQDISVIQGNELSSGTALTGELYISDISAHSLYGQISCTDQHQRITFSPWSLKLDVPAVVVSLSYDTVQLKAALTSSPTLTTSGGCFAEFSESSAFSGVSSVALQTELSGYIEITNLLAHTVYARFKCPGSLQEDTYAVASTELAMPAFISGASIAISSSELTSAVSNPLFFGGSGQADMYITNTAGCASGGQWESYSAQKNWDLAQSNSTATVYVKFRDSIQRESDCISDTILHDDTVPVAPSSFVNGPGSSLSQTGVSSWTAGSDAGSGISHYEFAVGSTEGGTDVLDWTAIGIVTSHQQTGLSLVASTNYFSSLRAMDHAGNISTVLEGTAWLSSCPSGYIPVPGNTAAGLGGEVYTHGTKSNYDWTNGTLTSRETGDFCVMKYEAKDDGSVNHVAISVASGTPWVSIDRENAAANNDAQEACENNGAGYQLIGNHHWQAIARDIESVSSNFDTSGVVADHAFNRGHSNGSAALPASTDDANGCFGITSNGDPPDNCGGVDQWHINKRTHSLSNGEVIWDLAGNVYEWVRDNHNTSSVDPNAFMRDWLNSSPPPSGAEVLKWGPAEGYSAQTGTQRAGLGYFGSGLGAFNGAFVRGGYWGNGANAGLFLGKGRYDGPADADLDLGFRCVFAP
jgi:hypothetical protein